MGETSEMPTWLIDAQREWSWGGLTLVGLHLVDLIELGPPFYKSVNLCELVGMNLWVVCFVYIVVAMLLNA